MASKLGGLRKRKHNSATTFRIIPVKRETRSSKMSSEKTSTQHACYDLNDPELFGESKSTIELDPLTESVRYQVKRTRLATPPLDDDMSSDNISLSQSQIDDSNTSTDNDSMQLVSESYLVADSSKLTTKESFQTKDSLQSTKEHEQDQRVSVSSSGDELALRDSGLASIGKIGKVKGWFFFGHTRISLN